jgi:hypothetical protein
MDGAPVNKFHFFNTPTEYRAWVLSEDLFSQFNTVDEWANLFGVDVDTLWPDEMSHAWEDDAYTDFVPKYLGNLDGPDAHEFPVVVCFIYYQDFDRTGPVDARVFDWASLPVQEK